MSDGEKLVVLYTREQIVEAVRRLAFEIRRDYEDKNPLVVGILKNSFMFIADLIRELAVPVEVEFVVLTSYGGAESPVRFRMVKGVQSNVKGRHVLVVEDIVSSGYTITYLLDYLRQRRPASLKLCVLLDKEVARKVPVMIDYRGFRVPDRFLVGYGIDYDE
ncbi:MAG: hypoxanthine phosphoribosyltransferase, partial [Dehalococcoidia bacterium]|nr:hypoxanthine phosphoribosyltransferase [Dehalococcoidia bacterium]